MSIVDELRERGQDEDSPGSVSLLCDDAADLIEALQQRVDELTASGYRLSGLAFEAKRQRDQMADERDMLRGVLMLIEEECLGHRRISLIHQKARAALKPNESETEE